jgi:enoyl-[acyl-carrier protein] reductase II
MINSKLCELIGIKYPLFQGGMAWIADGRLAAAVSNGGGLGLIAAGNAPASYVREQIKIAASLTDKPFGVNIMLMSPLRTSGTGGKRGKGGGCYHRCGKPLKVYGAVEVCRNQGNSGCSLSCDGKADDQTWCSAVIAEGGESGGHVGELTTMVLVPQVCDVTTCPLSGRRYSRCRGMAAAFMLGACGIQVEHVSYVLMSAISIKIIRTRF